MAGIHFKSGLASEVCKKQSGCLHLCVSSNSSGFESHIFPALANLLHLTMHPQQELSVVPLLPLFSRRHGDSKELGYFLKATCMCATSE